LWLVLHFRHDLSHRLLEHRLGVVLGVVHGDDHTAAGHDHGGHGGGQAAHDAHFLVLVSRWVQTWCPS